MAKITPDEIKLISQYVVSKTGIYLDQSKGYLIETRFNGLLDELGCTSYSDLYYKAKSDSTKKIERKIIDAITTKETLFFRDHAPFEMLQHKILPELIDRRVAQSKGSPASIRVWSSACSTGQEVYSINMVLKDLIPNINQYNIKVLGTDISDAAIAQASYGQYNRFEIERGLPRNRLQKYFNLVGNNWKVKDEVRVLSTFKKQNLMDPFVGLGKWDIIFCRNVAIYFTPEEKRKLFNKIADILEFDGYLIIGSTESLFGVCDRFEPSRHIRSVFYKLKRRLA
ncbi:MAG: protein-glutamate O-methyltransferase CheR [Thermodesulfobacteriota bacterium]|nr:protein-glutamate O-methyltransferase CheR [Thermodesulfobacteriota bacterium]